MTKRIVALLIVIVLVTGTATVAQAYTAPDVWHLKMTGADMVSGIGLTGEGVRVGVIDSGVNEHADLAGKIAEGHNYIAGDSDPEDTLDTYGHGTRVAGLIAGSVTGIAPGATIVPLKCTNGHSVKVSAITAAIYGGVDDFDCDVLNISIGISTDNESMKKAIEYAVSKNVTVVASAGNSGNRTVYYPAGYDGVMGVGSVDINGAVYVNSNHNVSVFISAPGADVYTTHSLGGYVASTGTSYSSPIVAGAAAVLKGLGPELSCGDIADLLAEGASDEMPEGYDEYYGYGIVNIWNSVQLYYEKHPAGNIFDEIEQCPLDENCPISGYEDLDAVSWYHDGIHFVLSQGIMIGMAENIFMPDTAMTRAMVCTTLYRMEGEPETTSEAPFGDIPDGKYYSPAVRWAAGCGLAAGYPDGSFYPDREITREELVTLFYRYASYKGEDTKPEGDCSEFPDGSDVSAYAKESVNWAIGCGMISGREDNGSVLIYPKASSTRAETATMLMNFFKLTN